MLHGSAEETGVDDPMHLTQRYAGDGCRLIRRHERWLGREHRKSFQYFGRYIVVTSTLPEHRVVCSPRRERRGAREAWPRNSPVPLAGAPVTVDKIGIVL